MKANRIDRVLHEWCKKNDRWIYVEYNELRKVVGLNFMQGDEYEHFKKNWAFNNEALMEFYNVMVYTFPIEIAKCNTIEFINKVMWAFHEAGVIYDEYN
jgi:hypothetical protein